MTVIDGFEWDDGKDAANAAKHGYPLRFALALFGDPGTVDLAANATSAGEPCRRAVGRVGPIVLTCVYTLRSGRRRIVSLRPASRRERRAYATQSRNPASRG